MVAHITPVFRRLLAAIEIVLDAPGARTFGPLVTRQLRTVLADSHGAARVVTPKHTVVMAAVRALKVLTIAQHALQALSMEEVALALAHLHDIYLLQVSSLLILQQLHLRCRHRLDVFVELPVAYRAILLL